MNNNGTLDISSDFGIPNVTVNLYEDADKNGIPDGLAIATTTTDTNGNYLFDSLLVGNYIVGITPPASTPTSSTPTVSIDNNVDNDDNGTQTVPSGSEIFSPSIELG